jgi:hypothetical protein
LLAGTGAGVLVLAGVLGADDGDVSNANANGTTISATKTASAISTFFL